MTLFDAIFAEAAITFGKRRGHAETLTTYSTTWKTVGERADHAIWMWNDKYGPLNAGQRDYACKLVVSALRYARTHAPSVGQTYAFFHTQLTHLLNHERVHHGFLSRASTAEEEAAFLDDLQTFAAVA